MSEFRLNYNFESVRESTSESTHETGIIEGQIFQSREKRYEIWRAVFSQDKTLGIYVL
jgi:hypothetical protein